MCSFQVMRKTPVHPQFTIIDPPPDNIHVPVHYAISGSKYNDRLARMVRAVISHHSDKNAVLSWCHLIIFMA